MTDRLAATEGLLDSIRGRVARGPATFHLLVPNPAPAEWHPGHPERRDKVAEAERVLKAALPEISEAAGDTVAHRVAHLGLPVTTISRRHGAKDDD